VSHPVLALRQFADGTVLIGTREGGLILPEGGRFRRYTTSHGLSDQTIFTLVEDRDGNPWMSTLTGGAIKLLRHGFTTYNQIKSRNRAACTIPCCNRTY
jgi:ligand-binding sensor domain-containing protein